MKTLLVLLASILVNSVSLCQIVEKYPFKTILDDNNDLYIVGNKYNKATNSIDILMEKYDNQGIMFWSKFYPNNEGIDKGFDVDIDILGYVFIVGYIYNNSTNNNDIIVIGLNPDGTLRWNEIFENTGDDKGMGIEIAKNVNGYATEVYISGYITNHGTGKDFIIKGYNAEDGDTTNQIHQITPLPGNQVATDILLDDFHAYVVGYTTEADGINTDIKIQTYDLGSNSLSEDLTYSRPGSSEKPSEFVITDYSRSAVSKSRSAVVSITDEIIFGVARQRYLTVYFNEDANHQLQVRWANTLSSTVMMSNSIATALTTDSIGNVFVTGYMQTEKNKITGQSNGLDFATVKYDANGNFGWREPGNIIFSNYNDTSTTGNNDRASSIKINNGGVMYVAGMSDGSPNGFSIAEIKDDGRGPVPLRKNSFVPNFMESDDPDVQKLNLWAKLELTSDGTPLMITMGWNDYEAHWAAVKYDQQGNIEYTINNDPIDDAIADNDASSVSNTKNEQNIISIKNYPNPFNPTTNLEYGISELGYVSLKVYDMMGREVVTLVNEKKNAGIHSVIFDGSSLSSGIYYYTLTVDGIRMETKSMVLMK
jgi:hypothetical protein